MPTQLPRYNMMRRTFPVTVHIFLIRDGQLLLLRRCNTGYEDGSYSVVAGHLDGAETVLQAAVREAKEEVGIDILLEQLKVAGVMHRFSDDERFDFFVSTTLWLGDPVNKEPTKCDELGWHSFDSLPEKTIPYIRQAFINFQKGIWFDEVGWEDKN